MTALGCCKRIFFRSVGQVLMLLGETTHMKKSQFYSLSRYLFNTSALHNLVQINLCLHDHVEYVCATAFNEHAVCSLLAQLIYFRDKLEEAAQKICCH